MTNTSDSQTSFHTHIKNSWGFTSSTSVHCVKFRLPTDPDLWGWSADGSSAAWEDLHSKGLTVHSPNHQCCHDDAAGLPEISKFDPAYFLARLQYKNNECSTFVVVTENVAHFGGYKDLWLWLRMQFDLIWSDSANFNQYVLIHYVYSTANML